MSVPQKHTKRFVLSLKTVLLLTVAVPLAAFLWLSGRGAYQAYTTYTSLEDQLYLHRLAQAGPAIAAAIPVENRATAATKSELRGNTDRALAELRAAFDAWKEQGNSDAMVEQIVQFIEDKRAELDAIRLAVDSGSQNVEFIKLQPLVAASIQLMSRAALTSHDLDMARAFDGYFSLMQVMDSSFMERRFGETILSSGKISPTALTFMTKARELRQEYTPRMRQLLPDEIVAEFDEFSAANDAKLDAVRARVFAGEILEPDPAALAVWQEVALARSGMLAGLVKKTGELQVASAAAALERHYRQFVKEAATSLVISLVVLACSFVALRHVSRTIHTLAGRMKSLADGDTASAIPFTERDDEIGAMASSLEFFKAKSIESNRLVAEQEADKARADQEKRRTMVALADEFEAVVGNIVTSVSSSASQLMASAQQLSTVSSQTAQQANTVVAASEEASSNVQTVAAAAEQLSASVEGVGRQVAQSAQMSDLAVREADGTVTKVQRLAESAARIGDIVGIIQDIAGQTNLLALNATIEAARAGEAGRGFAVVAAEVKSLADQTAKATIEISNQIATIQATTTDSAKAIEDISNRIRDLNTVASSIAASVQEQGSTTIEIARNVNEAARGTNEVAGSIQAVQQASGTVSSASGEMLHAAEALADLSGKLKGVMDNFLGTIRAA